MAAAVEAGGAIRPTKNGSDHKSRRGGTIPKTTTATEHQKRMSALSHRSQVGAIPGGQTALQKLRWYYSDLALYCFREMAEIDSLLSLAGSERTYSRENIYTKKSHNCKVSSVHFNNWRLLDEKT